jgi:hypothetical protein
MCIIIHDEVGYVSTYFFILINIKHCYYNFNQVFFLISIFYENVVSNIFLIKHIL